MPYKPRHKFTVTPAGPGFKLPGDHLRTDGVVASISVNIFGYKGCPTCVKPGDRCLSTVDRERGVLHPCERCLAGEGDLELCRQHFEIGVPLHLKKPLPFSFPAPPAASTTTTATAASTTTTATAASTTTTAYSSVPKALLDALISVNVNPHRASHELNFTTTLAATTSNIQAAQLECDEAEAACNEANTAIKANRRDQKAHEHAHNEAKEEGLRLENERIRRIQRQVDAERKLAAARDEVSAARAEQENYSSMIAFLEQRSTNTQWLDDPPKGFEIVAETIKLQLKTRAHEERDT